MIKAVIFDLDGTLANTIYDLHKAMNSMLDRLGYKRRTIADLTKFINNGMREFVRRSLPRDVQNVDFILESAVQIYAEEYEKCYCEKTVAYPGIEAMLMELKSRGYKIAVLSNKQDSFVKEIIYKLFDKKIFTEVRGQSNLPPKPNPSSIFALCKAMGVKPNKCVYVGDSDVDVETSINAGTKLIAVNWGYRKEDVLREAGALYVASKPEDVVELVKELATY